MIPLASEHLQVTSKANQHVSCKHPDHDIIFAIRNKMRQTKTQWQYTHVRGHQDDKKDTQELNHLEQLNVEMDALGK
jgi:hypothetical protein